MIIRNDLAPVSELFEVADWWGKYLTLKVYRNNYLFVFMGICIILLKSEDSQQ